MAQTRFHAFKPTPEQRATVKTMTAFGVPQDVISGVLKITENTLRRRFKDEIATALGEANARIAQALYQQAMGGNVSAQIFWLKCRARWRETAPELPEGQTLGYVLIPTKKLAAPVIEAEDLNAVDESPPIKLPKRI